jgi:UDP-arabinose 4-epimerase
MARVLITGGAGYVGSHCAKALAIAGHEGVVYDNLIRGHRQAVRWGPLIVGDLRDAASLRKAFAERRFDAVLHFAALAYVGESMSDPSAYYDFNVHGARCLLQAMRDADVDKIVFSSSCAVYGQPAALPISECAPLAPINPYGFSKLVCERMMDDFDAAYELKSVRLRYFNAAGADPDGEIGEDHEPETHLIPLVLDAAIRARPAIRVLGVDYPTTDGTAVRDYVHVADLATAHVRALNHLLAGGATMAVNLGSGRGVSVREIVAGVERITGRAVVVEETARRPGDPAILVADPSEACRRLGWAPARSNLDDLLRDAWAWRRRRAPL